MKYEWKKNEKDIYLPKEEPILINIPKISYLVIDGKGDPNTSLEFQKNIQVLYSLSYGIKMAPKNGINPKGYYDYAVYPLEGVWSFDDKVTDFRVVDKSHFVYSLMIRQPDFVDQNLINEIIEKTKKKKNLPNLDKVRFETIEEGLCVQMMHIGSFDDEAKNFKRMEEFCQENNLKRISYTHREIYLSDFRKTETSKLKTVLRFKVEKM